ncbi:uncharacterized protein LOC126906974 [Daktulosphaira vitifoliae]|uniref:uncharacterized protein LOC126906974 n=1 Tax=Daktulosphaira vitifoliae TaxID=58002 RepID=UPI0021A9C367|nr:uncharacterized protein LOC126906974 [Daktulosphaira vitifoliae]
MFYKTYYFVLILVIDFWFGDVFGSIILIGEEGVMNIMNLTNKTIMDHDTNKITIPGCISSSTVLQCGPITIDFVNKKKVFAEIFVNYNNSSIDSAHKTTIKITFAEKYITLSPRKTYKNYSYDDVGIKRLQDSIRKLNNKIQFNVIKIYESNLPNNRTLAYSTVYDNHLKTQLHMIVNLSIWPYVKEEIVNMDISTQSNITLEDFIINSTKYKKNVISTIEEAKRIMDVRTFKYAFLLLVYAHMTLKHDDSARIMDWKKFIKVSRQLSNAQINSKNFNNILYDLRVDFKIFETIDSESRQQIVKELMQKYTELFSIILNITDKSLQNVLSKGFQGFSDPCKDFGESNCFEIIPNQPTFIVINLKLLYGLIASQYSSFLSENYNEILNDSYSNVSRN